MKKRLLSLLLVLSMCMSIFMCTASAGFGSLSSREYTYYSDGSVNTMTLSSDSTVTVYYYDTEGNLIKTVSTYTNDNGDEYVSTTVYTYVDGVLAQETYTPDESGEMGYGYTAIYTFNNAQDTATVVYTYEDGTTWTETRTYNAAGQLITVADEYGDITEYTYNAAGYIETETFTMDEYWMRYTYYYDEDGNETKIVYEDSDGEKFTMGGDDDYLPFTDLNTNSYYYNAVLWAYDFGITTGTSDTTFSPNMDCNRAQIVTFLWRIAGCPEPESTETKFTDLNSNAYYYEAVLWAEQTGVTSGTSATTFSPNKSCTRAEVATFLYRVAGEPELDTEATDFTDLNANSYYYQAVLWANANNITNGTGDSKFSPNTTCNRAMIVTFLYRYMA